MPDDTPRSDDEVLRVVFLAEERTLRAGDSLTFGRAADLVVDEENRYLHRVLGRFGEHLGVWWLENLGSHIELELVSGEGTVVRVPPKPEGAPPPIVPLPGGPSTLGFEVAGARYELELLAPVRSGGPVAGVVSDDDTETLSFGRWRRSWAGGRSGVGCAVGATTVTRCSGRGPTPSTSCAVAGSCGSAGPPRSATSCTGPPAS